MFSSSRPVLSVFFLSSFFAFSNFAQEEKMPIGTLGQNEVWVRHFYRLPPSVKLILDNHTVRVMAGYQKVGENGLAAISISETTGLVVRDGLVLTSFHLLPDFLGVARDPGTQFKVYDGKDFFVAERYGHNWNSDLMLLRVNKIGEKGKEFSKQPAEFAPAEEKIFALAEFKHFYIFRFTPDGLAYSWIRLGPYLMDTNWVIKKWHPIVFGKVLGFAEEGFSGSPLVGPDGRIYGLVSRASDAFVYVNPLEVIEQFLNAVFNLKQEKSPQQPEEKRNP